MPEQLSGQLNLDLFDVPIALPSFTEEITVTTHQRKKCEKDKKLADLPTKKVHHELPEEDRLCDRCGTLMVGL
ncbi:hypothetical protein [Enterococcus gallinarum]|uniref:hypothetical protein n=1 Tax=Enterococcus gallinarum TaxID=1353 RepID=UPI0034A321ED